MRMPITQEQKNHLFVDLQKAAFNTLYCHDIHSLTLENSFGPKGYFSNKGVTCLSMKNKDV